LDATDLVLMGLEDLDVARDVALEVALDVVLLLVLQLHMQLESPTLIQSNTNSSLSVS